MSTLKKYLITLGIESLAVFLLALWKDVFSQTEAYMVFHILCDTFFAVGVTVTGYGLLVYTSNEGVFDGLVFGVSSFINMFRRNPVKKYDSLYDYKESRADKKMSFGFLVLCGLLFLVIGLIMLWPYHSLK